MAASPRVWLIASLVLNIALVYAVLDFAAAGRRDLSGATVVSGAAAVRPDPGASSGARLDPAAVAALRAALTDPDLAGWRDLLAAAGVEPVLRDELLRAALHRRYEPRFRALLPDFDRQARKVWWRDVDYSAHFSGRAGLEGERARRRLQNELDAEFDRLVGRDPVQAELAENAWLARDYGGLSAAKTLALRRLERDYQDLENEIRGESLGFELAADREKLRLLAEEKERDLAALLTPEERAAWELRASPAASRARDYAGRFDCDEAEYRRIYALVRDQERRREEIERIVPEDGERRWRLVQETETALEEAVRAIVGPERATTAARMSDADYDAARLAAERLGLPADTADRVFALRGPVEAGLRALAAESQLEPDAYLAATRALAEAARAGVVSALGAEAAAAYFERGGMGWLESLDRGEPVFFTPDGARPGPP